MLLKLDWTRWILLVTVVAALAGCGGGADPASGADAAGPSAVPPPDMPSDEELARVVAQVNGQAIDGRRLMEATEFSKFQLQSQGVVLDEEQERMMRRQVLDLVIASELMVQAAREAGMQADPARVEQMIDEIKAGFESEQAYRNYLAASKLTENSLREETERQLLQSMFTESLTGAVQVDEQLVRKIYDERKTEFKDGEQVRAAFILVKVTPEDPESRRTEARKRIEQAYQEIQDGKDFGEVARAYSQVPSAASGGDLGFFKRGDMVPKFEELAFGTPIGEVTEIFETPFGFNIVKVLDRKEPRQLSFEEVKPTLSLLVAQQQENDAVRSKLAELREAATVEIVDADLTGGDAEPSGPTEPSAAGQG